MLRRWPLAQLSIQAVLRTDGTLHALLRHQHDYTRRGSFEAIE